MGCGYVEGQLYDENGSPGWREELRRFAHEVDVPTILDCDDMDPIEDALYCDMKSWRQDGTTHRYNPAFGID